MIALPSEGGRPTPPLPPDGDRAGVEMTGGKGALSGDRVGHRKQLGQPPRSLPAAARLASCSEATR
jgi:hypothetical protein